ncbi:LytR/AlgR family response regulator transcription factor [Tenacibaculum sp. nBUS_03]|uniref:LytR/AlgR family response regulator transcription factor n=1 Tax=Tenacibaculum sp. nBUS_03 TaxID=3395320 RepID=UPI003EBFD545
MIKVVLVEDEMPARKKIKKYIEKLKHPVEVIKELETVEDVLAFFTNDPVVDLILSDIELLDGNVFGAYKNLELKIPIIFCTAYNEFWMNAFETTGIAYLLKPYSFERFEKALEKYLILNTGKVYESSNSVLLEKLNSYLNKSSQETKVFQGSFPVKTSKYTYFLKVDDIMYFQADYGVVFAFDKENKKHVLNQTSLKSIEEMVDSEKFFKINRSELIGRIYIEKISRYDKNSIAINILNSKTILKTSQNKTAEFSNWLGI